MKKHMKNIKKKKSFFKGLLESRKLAKDKKRKGIKDIKDIKDTSDKLNVLGVKGEQGKQLIKNCERISKWAIYILVFLLPLFFLPWTANILDFNKQVLLVVLVFVSLFAWLTKILVSGVITFKFAKLHFSVVILFIIVAASTFFSFWRYGSFWGWPLANSESLLSLICFVLLYFLIVNIFKKKDIFNLMTLLAISGFLVVLYGILQMFGKFILPFDFSKTTSFNTVGSINRLGMLTAVLLPLIIGLLMLTKKRILKVSFAVMIISSIVLLLLVNFSTIWWIVIIAATLIMAFGMQKSDFFDNRFLILPMFFLAISLFFIFFQFQIPGIPARSIEVFLTHRISFDMAIETIKTRPLLGSGPGTFIYTFSKYKDIDFNNNVFWNVRFDSSRSKMAGILGTLGVLGLFSYLVLFGLFLFSGIKFLLGGENKLSLKDHEKEQSLWLLGVSIFISFVTLSAGYFLYSSNLTLDFIFFLLMASFIALLPSDERSFKLKSSSLLTLGVTFALTIIFILGLGLFILEGQRYVAEVKYLNGINAWQEGRTDSALNYLEGAVKINPKTDLYWRELSQVYLKKINEEAVRTDISQDEINQRIQFLISNTVNAAKAATDINPENVANWSVRGFVYQNLVGVVSGVQEWSKDSYDEALRLEPINPYYPTQAGIAILREASFLPKEMEKEKNKLIVEARSYFEKAIELKQDYSPAHFQIALAYQSQGKITEAIKGLERTRVLAPRDIGLAFQLGLMYFQNRRFDLAANELERAVLINPKYTNALYFLGLAYDEQGEKTKAIEKFERLLRLSPNSSQIKIVLRNLRNGDKALKGIVQETPPEVPVKETPPEIE